MPKSCSVTDSFRAWIPELVSCSEEISHKGGKLEFPRDSLAVNITSEIRATPLKKYFDRLNLDKQVSKIHRNLEQESHPWHTHEQSPQPNIQPLPLLPFLCAKTWDGRSPSYHAECLSNTTPRWNNDQSTSRIKPPETLSNPSCDVCGQVLEKFRTKRSLKGQISSQRICACRGFVAHEAPERLSGA